MSAPEDSAAFHDPLVLQLASKLADYGELLQAAVAAVQAGLDFHDAFYGTGEPADYAPLGDLFEAQAHAVIGQAQGLVR